MAIKKLTGDPEIDSIISQIHKNFKKEELITIGPNREPIKVIPTTSLGLDIALGIGGLPVGRIIELYGAESSGKTSLALAIAANYEKIKSTLGHENKWFLIIDLEHSLRADFVESFGIDIDKILYIKPDTAEEAFQSMLDLTKSGKIGLVLFDSIDSAQTEAQLKKKIGENEMGGISKPMSRLMREYSKLCENTETTAIFINQIRQNPGQMFGSSEVTPGGNAIKFYASLRIKLLKGKPSTVISKAINMRAKIIKTKIAMPYPNEVEFAFRYAQGIHQAYDLMEVAKTLGVISFAGPSCKVCWESDSSDETLCSGGKAGFLELVNTNPETVDRLKARCWEVASNH